MLLLSVIQLFISLSSTGPLRQSESPLWMPLSLFTYSLFYGRFVEVFSQDHSTRYTFNVIAGHLTIGDFFIHRITIIGHQAIYFFIHGSSFEAFGIPLVNTAHNFHFIPLCCRQEEILFLMVLLQTRVCSTYHCWLFWTVSCFSPRQFI